METVELRVHGVHGTSPGVMLGLGNDDVGQVAGDGLTGVYRAKSGRSLPYRDLEGTHVSVEAYSWGALTSGVQGFLGWVKRALWLLLLPFALVNLAYWARLELGRDTAQARWGARSVRVSGLLLTVFFVLTPCVLAIDLAAWQCYRYGVPGCSRIPDQLDFVATWDPGQRMALATLVPMAVIALLWSLSKTSMSRYESVSDALDSPPVLSTRQVLLHPSLWNGGARTLRLQRSHLVAAIATVVAFSGIHLLHATHFPAPTGWALLLWVTVALGALLMLLAVLLVCVGHEDDVEPHVSSTYGGGLPRLAHRARALTPLFDTALLGLAAATYVLHLLALAQLSDSSGVDESLDFTGRNVWFIAVFVGLTLLHLSVFTGGRMRAGSAVLVVGSVVVAVLVIVVLRLTGRYDAADGWWVVAAAAVAVVFWLLLAHWQYRLSPARHADKAWRGAGASVLLATAAWIALLFTSSAVIASANYLNGDTHGVGDLVSRVNVDGRRVAPTTLALDSDDSTRRFVATGDVTLRHARLVVSGDEARVTSGTVEMKGLSLAVDPYRARDDAFTEGRGRTVTEKPSTLTVPARTLVLADTCLRQASGPCTAEDAQFHSSGVLTLPARTAGSTVPVTVKLASGVALAPSDAPEVPLAVPQVLIWTPIGQLLWLVVVALGVLACLVVYRRRVAPHLDEPFAEGRTPDALVPDRDRARALKARTSAALAHRAETLLDVVGAITSPVALVIVVASMSGSPPWELDLPFVGWTREIATAAMYLVVAMSAGLVLLGSQIRRSEKARKAVGVIWDLTTFWPRAAHPLGPPCYAERVVPELQIRARWALDKPHAMRNQVIVSGHSQGSLIVLAMVSRLNPVHLSRIRMITYGSQIRALYGRVFPRVFGPDAVGYQPTTGQPSLIDAFPDVPRPTGTVPGPPPLVADTFRYRLRTAGGEWVNLFRRTDPLGWRVFSDVDSDLDLPVPEVPEEGVGDPGPAVMGHSGYQHTPTYRRVVQRWTGEPFVPAPQGTEDLPVLPRPSRVSGVSPPDPAGARTLGSHLVLSTATTASAAPVGVAVVGAVLAAAVLHAVWNALAHAIEDQLVGFALMGVGLTVGAAAIVVVSPLPETASWGYLLTSVVLHVVYNLLLMRSYRLGEFGQVYPLARGTSPLLVAVAGAVFVGEHLSVVRLLGVLVISVGLGLLVFVGGIPTRAARPAIVAAVMTGVVIAAYTTVDGLGVRSAGSVAGYAGWLFLLQGPALPLAAVVTRRRQLWTQMRPHLLRGLAGGVLSLAAYGLVLWAQTRGALAPIAALRETSVIVGAVIGAVVFGEKFGRWRIAATVLVAGGVVLVTL